MSKFKEICEAINRGLGFCGRLARRSFRRTLRQPRRFLRSVKHDRDGRFAKLQSDFFKNLAVVTFAISILTPAFEGLNTGRNPSVAIIFAGATVSSLFLTLAHIIIKDAPVAIRTQIPHKSVRRRRKL